MFGSTLPALAPLLALTLTGTTVELQVTPRSDAERVRVARLGWEGRPDPSTPGAITLFVPESEIDTVRATAARVTLVRRDVEAYYANRLTGNVPLAPATSRLGTGSMGGYFTYDEVIAEMDLLAATYPLLVAGKTSIGQSVEGREQWVWKLSTNAAVDATRGVVCAGDGRVANTVYSVSCGGLTANNEDVWEGKPLPYLRSRNDAIDDESRSRHAGDALRKELAGRGNEGMQIAIRFGDPGHEIARYAKEVGAALVVTACHGQTGLKHLLIGSVAERVVRLAHCPVLVLKD